MPVFTHSFTSTRAGGESDMRFVYCACAVSYMLNDWSGVDTEAATRYIQRSQVLGLSNTFEIQVAVADLPSLMHIYYTTLDVCARVRRSQVY